MAVHDNVFAEEEGLVAAFFEHLMRGETEWMAKSAIREFDYNSGRADILFLSGNGELVAVEAKLTNWRKALHQAWRNTSYVNRAYVALPKNRASTALSHRQDFKDLGVGLCLVDGEGVEVVIESRTKEPVILWLHNKARGALAGHGGGSDRDVGAHDLPSEQLCVRAGV